MRQAYQIAKNHSEARKKKDINRHNTKVKPLNIINPGDRVLVRNLSERGGTGKLRNHWEEKIHKIVSVIGEGSITLRRNFRVDLFSRVIFFNISRGINFANWLSVDFS